MMKEMEALKKNITWDLVSLPNGKYLMDVNGFLLKYKSDGSIERHKDMLVGEVLHKHMELIVKKPFLLLLR